MMNYVYIPVEDHDFDNFATALVMAKNWTATTKRFSLLSRDMEHPLRRVEKGDRLFVGIHGSQTGRVFTEDHGEPVNIMNGSELTDLLIAAGLPRCRFKLDLWICWGGAKTRDGRSGSALDTPVVTQVASRLKHRGYSHVTVIGYTREVNIDPANITDTQRLTLLDETQQPITTFGRRTVRFSFWRRAQ